MVKPDVLKIPAPISILDILWGVSLLLLTYSQLLSDAPPFSSSLTAGIENHLITPNSADMMQTVKPPQHDIFLVLPHMHWCLSWIKMLYFSISHHIPVGIQKPENTLHWHEHNIYYNKASFTLSIYLGKLGFSLFTVVHLLRLTNRLRWALIGNILFPTHLHSSTCVMSVNKICHLSFSLALEWVTLPH